MCHVPALRDSQGNWHRTAEEKAQLLADTFAAKYSLEEAEENEYSDLGSLGEAEQDWTLGTEADAEKVLAALREDSGTGPDGVPTRVLKHCAKQLAGPLLKLARSSLAWGFWPELCAAALDCAIVQKGCSLAARQLQRSALDLPAGQGYRKTTTA